MGLGAARKRTKLSHDPNNTKWTRATTNFGHQQLLAQGWTPGTNLGVLDAPYAQFHTEASASHIRVSQTAENLGLGVAQGSSSFLPAQYTGLDAFQGLLGRLNGKSETDLEKEQKARDDLKATMYADRKWGGLRFVSGGFLAGTRQEGPEKVELQDAVVTEGQDLLAASTAAIKISGNEEVSSRAEDESLSIEVTAKSSIVDTKTESEQGAVAGPCSSKAQRKVEKAQRKLDRRKRREAKRLRREARQAKRTPCSGEQPSETISIPGGVHIAEKARIKDPSPISLRAPPPIQTSKVSHVPQKSLQGRHAVRARHIQQQKMGLLDPKALNEILMIRA